MNENTHELRATKDFGLLLKNYRKPRNLSLKELESISRVSAGYIHRLEAGERESPTVKKVLQLSQALQLPRPVLIATIIKLYP